MDGALHHAPQNNATGTNGPYHCNLSASSAAGASGNVGDQADEESSISQLVPPKKRFQPRKASSVTRPSQFKIIHQDQRQATCYSAECSESSASERYMVFAMSSGESNISGEVLLDHPGNSLAQPKHRQEE